MPPGRVSLLLGSLPHATQDLGKIAARAARFGVQAPSAQATATTKTNGKKRSAPPEPVDEEELARRKKRAERFGMPLVVSTIP